MSDAARAEAGLPSPMLRAHFSNGYLTSPAIPEYSEAVEISRYGSQDVHAHYRSVINVIAIFQQLGLYHEIAMGEDGGKCPLRSVT